MDALAWRVRSARKDSDQKMMDVVDAT